MISSICILYAVYMRRKVCLSIITVLLFLGSAGGVNSQNVSVTASVNPDAGDLQFDFQALSAQNIFPQYSTLEYKITYGSDVFTPIPITLEANWEEGTIENTMTTVAVLNYVDGSATKAYGNNSPVIDLINNKITWSIAAFPGQTRDEEVRYSVRTNNLYKGSSLVNFINKAKFRSVSLELPEINVEKKYLYEASLEPTSTPTPTQSQSSQQTGVATNTPAPISSYPTPTTWLNSVRDQILRINQITLRGVTSDSIKILVEANYSSVFRVSYGQLEDFLDESVESKEYAINNEFNIENLKPETEYYLRVEAINRSGRLIRSNLYRFKTARQSKPPSIANKSIIITSAHNILTDPVLTAGKDSTDSPVIVLPSQQVFEFKFSLNNFRSAKKIKLFIQRKNVLGLSTSENSEKYEGAELIDAIEVSPGVFAGSLKAPSEPGNYEIIAKITDNNGNIVEQKLADLRVSEKLRVLSDKSNKPVEGARVLLYYFNQQSKSFELLPPQVFKYTNPIFTYVNGEISATLAQGRYLAEISALGYENKKTEFVIGLNPGEDYPTIILRKEPFNVVTSSQYYLSVFNDALSATKEYVRNISNSNRFFELNSLIILSILVLLTIYSYATRIRIPLHSLLDFFIHHSTIILDNQGLREVISGNIFDGKLSQSARGADVYLIDKKNNKIVNHVKTDNNGDFRFTKLKDKSYVIEVMKDGHEPVKVSEADLAKQKSGKYIISFEDNSRPASLKKLVFGFFRRILSMLFEILLLITLTFELALGYTLGWDKALPFAAVSLLNIYLWLSRLYYSRNI